MEMGGTNKSNVEGASECRSEWTCGSGALCLGFVRNGKHVVHAEAVVNAVAVWLSRIKVGDRCCKGDRECLVFWKLG